MDPLFFRIAACTITGPIADLNLSFHTTEFPRVWKAAVSAKAFDMVDHYILRDRLGSTGISGHSLAWFSIRDRELNPSLSLRRFLTFCSTPIKPRLCGSGTVSPPV